MLSFAFYQCYCHGSRDASVHQLDSWSVLHFCSRWNSPTTMGSVGMTFCTNIGGAHTIRLNDFGDPPTCLIVSPACQSFHTFCEISQHLLDHLAQMFIQTFLVPRRYILITFNLSSTLVSGQTPAKLMIFPSASAVLSVYANMLN